MGALSCDLCRAAGLELGRRVSILAIIRLVMNKNGSSGM